RSHSFAKNVDQIDVAVREVRPAIILRQVDRYIVCGLALSHQETDALQIPGHIRHHNPPQILLIEHSRGIKVPTRIFDTFDNVEPAVTDQLIDSLKKVAISFCLHIKWRSAKWR